ncbi:MAG TPA: hypothetical protein VKY56_01660 [Chloroflexota bacterium]|jgi:hypothetical protein|nr:hypothetical protein [Chloroflexota bacterium]
MARLLGRARSRTRRLLWLGMVLLAVLAGAAGWMGMGGAHPFG